MIQVRGSQRTEASEPPFFLICEQLDLKPEECLMLGDWPERDAQGGKLAGMKTRLAKYGQIQQAKADYQIESFSKLLTMVDRCDKE